MMETKKEECILCNKIKERENILYETDNFVVIAGYMIASSGHVMVVPKEHYPCLGLLPEQLYNEYLDLCNKTNEAIKETFGKCFFIDYGPNAQSINHMHTHFIPLKSKEYDIKDIIQEAVIPTKMKFEKADLHDLKKVYEKEKEYIWFGVDDSSYIYHIIGKYDFSIHLSWRYFLSCIRKVKSIPLHWSEPTDEQKESDNLKIKETKEKLKRYFYP